MLELEVESHAGTEEAVRRTMRRWRQYQFAFECAKLKHREMIYRAHLDRRSPRAIRLIRTGSQRSRARFKTGKPRDWERAAR